MKYILVADIGGTNQRFAMIKILGKNSFEIKKIKDIHINNNIIDPINDFLRECANEKMTTHKACFSVAGPIENNSCPNPTNHKFPIYEEEIILGTAISDFLVINDFEAIGEAISIMDIDNEIKNNNLSVILNSQKKSPKPCLTGNRAVIGPGTGLGIAYLINNDGKYIVSASEGGHSSISHRGNLENLFEYIRNKLKIKQIEMEALVSGQGIKHIIEFFLEHPENFNDFLKENPEYLRVEEKILVNNDQEKTDNLLKKAFENNEDVPQLVSSLVNQNGKALLTMKLFIEFLGIACGDVALHGNSTGGLFIAGGIAIKNKNLLMNFNDFRKGFDENWKNNIKELLSNVPIYLIEDYDISFIGCVIAFEKKYN